MSHSKLVLLGFSLATALTGCLETPQGPEKSTIKSSESEKNQKSAIFQLINENVVDKNGLNTIDYKVTHLTVTDLVGVSFKMYLPIISTQLPKNADYLDILRCSTEFEIVEKLKRASASTQPSELWPTAAKVCQAVVKKGISTQNIIDYRAKAGTYYYAARACVRAERASGGDTANCSQLITVSPKAYTFEDRLAQRVDAVREEMARARDEISAINVRIQGYAVGLNNAQARCQERTDDKQRLLDKHNNLMKMLKFGVGAAEKLIGAGLSNFNAEKILDILPDAAQTFADPKTATMLQQSLALAKRTATDDSLPVAEQITAAQVKTACAAPKKKTTTEGETLKNDKVDTGAPKDTIALALDNPTAADCVLANTNWGELRSTIEGMIATPEEVMSPNQCPGVAEVNDKLKADRAQLLANQLSITLMEEAYANAQSVKDTLNGLGD